MRWLLGQDVILSRLGIKTVRTAAGFSMAVNPYEHVGRYIFVDGVYEEEISKTFCRILKHNDCVLDVGANIGWFSLLSASLVGTGEVHSFEPCTDLAAILSHNVALNGYKNSHVHRRVVGDKVGTVRFYQCSGQNMGLSSIRDLGGLSTMTTAESLTLDSILGTLPPVTLVKIDVEGAEHKVLDGMKELIRRDRPYLILEVNDVFLKEMGSSETMILEFLADSGYEVCIPGKKGCPVTVCRLPGVGQYNVLATHETRAVD